MSEGRIGDVWVLLWSRQEKHIVRSQVKVFASEARARSEADTLEDLGVGFVLTAVRVIQ